VRKFVAAFSIAASAGIVLSAVVAQSQPILATRWSLLWRLALWAITWLIAVAVALRLPRRLALAMILATALAIRVAALTGPPTTSDDLYRYSWDAQVQSAGIDPYRYPPAGPQLTSVRDPWLWPDAAGCTALRRPAGCTRINRPNVRTIYPPVAEAWFTAVHRIAGLGARHKAWQVAGLAVDVATIGLLAVGLRRWGRDERWVALYALCPVPALEFVNNGHVDGLAVAFIVAAFVVAADPHAWSRHRSRPGRDLAVGVLLGAAILVKLYPAALLLALPGLPRRRPWLSALRSTAAATAIVVAGYLPHLLRVGPTVLGYLPGYLREEHYEQGGRFLLAAALGLHGRAAGVLAAVALTTVVIVVLGRRPGSLQASAVVLAALLLVATPVQPWYAVSLLAIATLTGRPWWAAIVVAGYPYFFAVILDYRHTTGLGQLSYASALAVVVVAVVRPLLSLAGGRDRNRTAVQLAGGT
jgi:hypothetical protein